MHRYTLEQYPLCLDLHPWERPWLARLGVEDMTRVQSGARPMFGPCGHMVWEELGENTRLFFLTGPGLDVSDRIALPAGLDELTFSPDGTRLAYRSREGWWVPGTWRPPQADSTTTHRPRPPTHRGHHREDATRRRRPTDRTRGFLPPKARFGPSPEASSENPATAPEAWGVV